jgi:hypothetical protein
LQRLREDLEGKLSAALGNMEMELRKYVTYDSAGVVHFQQSLSEEQVNDMYKVFLRVCLEAFCTLKYSNNIFLNKDLIHPLVTLTKFDAFSFLKESSIK